MVSKEEARGKAIQDGILPEQITDAILAYYGHIPSNPTSGLQVGAVYTTDEVKAYLQSLDAARKANQIPQQILGIVTGVLGWAKQSGLIGLCILICVLIMGCDDKAARQTVEATSKSVKALNDQHLAFEERFIANYRERETSRILELHKAAMDSAVKEVTDIQEQVVKVPVKAIDGTDAFKEEKRMVSVKVAMVPTNVAEALEKQKARLITEMTSNIILMRKQQADICSNAVNASLFLEALQAYFEQRQLTYETMLAAEQNLLGFVEKFMTK